MAMKSSAQRYGDVAIAMHWISAAAIVVLFATGVLAAGQADEAARLALLRLHVPLALVVVALTVLRLVWWWLVDRRPAPPAGEAAWQRGASRVVHAGLYVIVLVLGASGIATLVLSGAMPAIISGTTLPPLETLPPRLVHGLASKLLLGLFAVHVLAALWHQFIRRDRLLARMGLGA